MWPDPRKCSRAGQGYLTGRGGERTTGTAARGGGVSGPWGADTADYGAPSLSPSKGGFLFGYFPDVMVGVFGCEGGRQDGPGNGRGWTKVVMVSGNLCCLCIASARLCPEKSSSIYNT